MSRNVTIEATYPGFIPIRLKLIASNFHTPKLMILYYVYGELPKFHTPKLKFPGNRAPKGASHAPR